MSKHQDIWPGRTDLCVHMGMTKDELQHQEQQASAWKCMLLKAAYSFCFDGVCRDQPMQFEATLFRDN